MRIACDVDGVLADLHIEWLRRYNADSGDDLKPEEITAWNIQHFVVPEYRTKIFDYLRADDLYDTVPTIAGSVEGVRELRGLGHRVFFATSCVMGMTDPKWRWLQRYGYFTEETAQHRSQVDLVMVSDKTLLDAHLLIDDRDQHVAEWVERDRRAIIFDAPYNQDFEDDIPANRAPWYKRCYGWEEIVDHVYDMEVV